MFHLVIYSIHLWLNSIRCMVKDYSDSEIGNLIYIYICVYMNIISVCL